MPKISVIIPVYNTEKYLERCIQSLINQTLSDIEILFINDCSTDNSLEILKKYEKLDSRIKVYSLEKNSGAAVARNKGLENAAGEFFNFVDPDDTIDLDFYEKLYTKAIETDAQVVKCSRRTFGTDGKITYSTLNTIIKEKGNLFFGFEWTCAIFKSSLIKENNIKFTPELIKAQDTAFLLAVMLKTTKPIEFVEDVYYNYYRRCDSLNAAKIPLKSIKSAVLSQKIQCGALNNSDLFEKNPKLYIELYIQRPVALAILTAFQNSEYEAKFVCAQGVLDCYAMCKDKKTFLSMFPYKSLRPYIKKNNAKKLAKFLQEMKNSEELCNYVSLSLLEKIFSVRNSRDKKYKIFRLLGLKFKFKKHNKQNIAAKIIHKNIKRYKFIHIMQNDKFNKPFVDFLNKNFNKNDHMVLCYRKPGYKDIIQKFPEGDNVYEYFDINDINLSKYKNIQKVIVHSLFMPNMAEYLYKNQKLLKEKTYWGIWGSDLYNAPRDEINDFVRSHFRGYLTGSDKEETQKRYKTNNNFLYSMYTFPVDKKLLDNVTCKKHDYIQIQLNNSCDKSTLLLLEILSKFKDENIKIVTVVSYGDLKYKDEIIAKGKDIFGNKFYAFEELLSPQKYVEHLANNDILILAQNRQQGGGNVLASLYLGKKVFIKSEISTYKHLTEVKKIKVYDTNKLNTLEFDELIINSSAKLNQERVKNFFDAEEMKHTWEIIFND